MICLQTASIIDVLFKICWKRILNSLKHILPCCWMTKYPSHNDKTALTPVLLHYRAKVFDSTPKKHFVCCLQAVLSLSGWILTLFLCKMWIALLTLFRAWTLVEPFSFAYKERKPNLTVQNQNLEYAICNTNLILHL